MRNALKIYFINENCFGLWSQFSKLELGSERVKK